MRFPPEQTFGGRIFALYSYMALKRERFVRELPLAARQAQTKVHEPETASPARVTRALPGVIGSLTRAAAV